MPKELTIRNHKCLANACGIIAPYTWACVQTQTYTCCRVLHAILYVSNLAGFAESGLAVYNTPSLGHYGQARYCRYTR